MALVVFCDICGAESEELPVTSKRPVPWPKGWTERRVDGYRQPMQACTSIECKARLRAGGELPRPETLNYQ